MKINIKKILFSILLLALAAIAPNIFVAAQAGFAEFSVMVIQFLLPSVALIFLLILLAKYLKFKDITRLSLNGILAGIIGTVALEIFRESGFLLGTMPGDLPKLMGVLMLNQFASGPDIWSNLAGWSYHFWNGAALGLIFSLLLGQGKIWYGLVYGLVIGLGFMISPVVKSLGIGLFGVDFKNGYEFATTVIIAHVACGVTLSFFLSKWNKGISNLLVRNRKIMVNEYSNLS